MTHIEQEMHRIDLELEVVNDKLRRLQAEKQQLMRRRQELSDRKHGGRLF